MNIETLTPPILMNDDHYLDHRLIRILCQFHLDSSFTLQTLCDYFILRNLAISLRVRNFFLILYT